MPGLNSRMHEVHFDQGITHAYFLIDKIGMQLNILLFLTILIDLKKNQSKIGNNWKNLNFSIFLYNFFNFSKSSFQCLES